MTVTVAHIGFPRFPNAPLSLTISNTENYWADPIIFANLREEDAWDNIVSLCSEIHSLGLPLDNFRMHGSTTWTSEMLRNAIKEQCN